MCKPDPAHLPLKHMPLKHMVSPITTTAESDCYTLTQVVCTQGLTVLQLEHRLEGLGLTSKGKKAELLDGLNTHHAQVCVGTSIAACSNLFLACEQQPVR